MISEKNVDDQGICLVYLKTEIYTTLLIDFENFTSIDCDARKNLCRIDSKAAHEGCQLTHDEPDLGPSFLIIFKNTTLTTPNEGFPC